MCVASIYQNDTELSIKSDIRNALTGEHASWEHRVSLIDLCKCITEEKNKCVLDATDITRLAASNFSADFIEACLGLLVAQTMCCAIEEDRNSIEAIDAAKWSDILKEQPLTISMLNYIKQLIELQEAPDMRESVHLRFLPLLTTVLEKSFKFLSDSISSFEHNHVLSYDDNHDEPTNDIAIGIIELVNAIIVSDQGRVSSQLFEQKLESIFSLIGPYLQISSGNESEWLADPNAFIANEQDELCGVTIRLAFEGLLADLMYSPSLSHELVPAALSTAIKLIRIGSGSWRVIEAALFIVSFIDVEGDRFRQPFREIVAGCINFCNTESTSPFLKARSFVVLSQLASHASVDDGILMSECCVKAMASDAEADLVKYAASRTFIAFLPICYTSKSPILVRERILALILRPSGAFSAFIKMSKLNGESLHYGLDAIRSLVQTCPEIVSKLGEEFYIFLRSLLVEHIKDPLVPACIEELADEIGNAVGGQEYAKLCEMFCESLLPWLHVDAEHELDIALDLLSVFVNHCEVPFPEKMQQCMRTLNQGNLQSVGSYTEEKISEILRTCTIRSN
jgi:hypothetical protein